MEAARYSTPFSSHDFRVSWAMSISQRGPLTVPRAIAMVPFHESTRGCERHLRLRGADACCRGNYGCPRGIETTALRAIPGTDRFMRGGRKQLVAVLSE